MQDKNIQKASKPYTLSENSIKMNNEFGEANEICSLIYGKFKQVMNPYWDRKKLNQFRGLILKIIRSAPSEQTGNRKLWDGDITLLEGFQINTKATARNLFRKSIDLTIGTSTGADLTITPFKYNQAFEKAHPKANIAQVKLYIFSFDIVNRTSSGKSIILLNQPRGEDLNKDFKLNIPLEDNRLALIIRKISFKSGPDNTDIMDRQYIGATLTNAIYIKNGKLVNFVPEPVKEIFKKADAPVGEWEDLG